MGELITKESLMGAQKVVVGDGTADLILNTLGKVYIKAGGRFKLLDDLITELSSVTVTTPVIVSNLTLLQTDEDLLTLVYPGDGKFVFIQSSQNLYITVNGIYLPIIAKNEAEINWQSLNERFVQKSGDVMSGTLEAYSLTANDSILTHGPINSDTSGVPFVIKSTKMVENLNVEQLGDLKRDAYAVKAEDEQVTGQWSFQNKTNFRKLVTFKDDLISADGFASGYAGYGWRMDAKTNTLTVDNLIVRRIMQVYELVVMKIRATNGALWVADSDKIMSVTKLVSPEVLTVFGDERFTEWKHYSFDGMHLCSGYDIDGTRIEFFEGAPIRDTNGNVITPQPGYDSNDDLDLVIALAIPNNPKRYLSSYFTGDFYKVVIENPKMYPFRVNDIVRCQKFTGSSIKTYDALITNIAPDNFIIIRLAVFNIEGLLYEIVPEVTDGLVRIGNISNANRQGAIYLTSSEQNSPYMDILTEVNRPDFSHPLLNDNGDVIATPKNLKLRLGNLSGIYDPAFGPRQPSGMGLYGENVFLKGNLVQVTAGEDIRVPVYRGKWDYTKIYWINDQVTYNEVIYTCIDDILASIPNTQNPEVDTAHWESSISSLTAELTSPSILINLDSDGVIKAGQLGSTGKYTNIKVFKGTTDVSSQYSITVGSYSGITLAYASGKLYIVSITDYTSKSLAVTLTKDGNTVRTLFWNITYIVDGRQGIDGISSVIASLSNDFSSVPSDAAGNTISASFNGCTSTMEIYKGTIVDTGNWTFITAPSTGVTMSGNNTKTVILTGLTVDSGYIDITASRSGYANITKRYSFVKNKQGITGTDATSYWLTASAQVVKKASSVYTPSTVTFTAKSQTGANAPGNYNGRFKFIPYNSSGQMTNITSTVDESSKTYTFAAGVIRVQCELYLAGNFTNLVDIEVVEIISDGIDGPKGDTGPSLTYEGEWSSTAHYYTRTDLRTAVKRTIIGTPTTITYYITKLSPSLVDFGIGLQPEIHPEYWDTFAGQFTSIATGLLLAENSIVNIAASNILYIGATGAAGVGAPGWAGNSAGIYSMATDAGGIQPLTWLKTDGSFITQSGNIGGWNINQTTITSPGNLISLNSAGHIDILGNGYLNIGSNISLKGNAVSNFGGLKIATDGTLYAEKAGLRTFQINPDGDFLFNGNFYLTNEGNTATITAALSDLFDVILNPDGQTIKTLVSKVNFASKGDITAYQVGSLSPESNGVLALLTGVGPIYKPSDTEVGLRYDTGQFQLSGGNTLQIIPSVLIPQSALDLKLNVSLKGSPNGLAELDSGGFVKTSQLPSYVDDVLEFTNIASLPVTGEAGKIYITLNTNITYRWSGSGYVPIGSDLALGETSQSAYRGDRGKIAYDHSQTAHQSILNGTGLVRMSGNSISYDNTTYYYSGNLPAYPTTLPASDVYTWAKQSVKPSYNTSEVTENTNLYYTNVRVKSYADTLYRPISYVPAWSEITSMPTWVSKMGWDGTQVTISTPLFVTGNITASQDVIAYIASGVTSDVLASLTTSPPLRKSSNSNIVLDIDTNTLSIVGGLLTVIGGGGISDLTNYYTKTASDARFKPIGYAPTWGEITGATPIWNQNTTGYASSAGTATKWGTTANDFSSILSSGINSLVGIHNTGGAYIFNASAVKSFLTLTNVDNTADANKSVAYATTSTNSTYLKVSDGSRDAALILPNDGYKMRLDFVGGGSVGTLSNYAGLMTLCPYDGTSASTGDASYQLAFGGTASNGGGVPMLRIRKGINTVWNSFYDIYHSGNFNKSDVPVNGSTGTFAGGIMATAINVSGTDSDGFVNLSKYNIAYANGIRVQTAGVNNWLIGTAETNDLKFHNYGLGTASLTIAYLTGAAIFSSSVTAGGGLFNRSIVVEGFYNSNQIKLSRTGNALGSGYIGADVNYLFKVSDGAMDYLTLAQTSGNLWVKGAATFSGGVTAPSFIGTASNADLFVGTNINTFVRYLGNVTSDVNANDLGTGFYFNTVGNGTNTPNFAHSYGTIITFDAGYFKSQMSFDPYGNMQIRGYNASAYNAWRQVWDSMSLNNSTTPFTASTGTFSSYVSSLYLMPTNGQIRSDSPFLLYNASGGAFQSISTGNLQSWGNINASGAGTFEGSVTIGTTDATSIINAGGANTNLTLKAAGTNGSISFMAGGVANGNISTREVLNLNGTTSSATFAGSVTTSSYMSAIGMYTNRISVYSGTELNLYNTLYLSGGAATFSGKITSVGSESGGCNTNGTDGWWRSVGQAGWFNATYGVGIYATAAGMVRTYNGSSFTSEGAVYSHNTSTGIDSDGTNLYIKSAGTTYLNSANSAYVSSAGMITSAVGQGFTNATYNNGYNRIWALGNALEYGFGYYQGSNNIYGNDYIGFHFGDRNTAQIAFISGGSIVAAGEITAYGSASDMRLKTITADNYNALDIINSLSTFKYKWNDTAKAIGEVFNNDQERYGISAQELEKINPYLVSKIIDDKYLVARKEELIPVLVKAIQELTKQIEELKNDRKN